jgi:hypothetical protein
MMNTETEHAKKKNKSNLIQNAARVVATTDANHIRVMRNADTRMNKNQTYREMKGSAATLL